MAVIDQTGLDALHRLKSTDPPQWLAPSSDFSKAARTASKHLFSSLNPHAPKSPFDQLLIDGFDAEQIWQQIDLQSKPLLSSLSREIKQFDKNPDEILKLRDVLVGERKVPVEKSKVLEEESDDFDDDLDDGFDEDDGDEDGESEEEGSESEEEDDEEQGEGVEDKFLKIKELKDYLKKDEAGEFGSKKKKDDGKSKMNNDDDDEDEDGNDEEDDELGLFGDGVDSDEEEGADKLARYDDFFGTSKKKTLKRDSGLIEGSEDSATDEEEGEEEQDEEDEEDDDVEDPIGNKKEGNLSTHEKQLEKNRSKIEQMEKANLEEKTWTMQGEVTAAKRPKNSALEVDLDFEHNVRPAPVITEEVTASLEEMIQKRILEERFDDVQKAPRLPTKAPRETKELDENKSKKGLAEVYEEEYVQKTDPASAPLTFSDEQKKEASVLFQKLCLKLDALSHFHFAPKPVIEDMFIQTNVPALAMEEIAPLAVSDAAMLAPEEVFAGKGDIKEEAELTQAERKRRRANKKRKFKAETIQRMSNKAPKKTLSTPSAGKEE